MSFLTKIKNSEWLIPAGLIALSLIPVAAGTFRLTELNSGIVTSENARFFVAPLVTTLHIFAVTLYSLLGAFQFSPSFRKRKPNWHRLSGKILIPAGLITSLAGLWMTQFFPHIKYDGNIVYITRLIVGTMMTAFILLGIEAIRNRNFSEHGAWMIRAYALGMGAGTQVLTHLPWFIFPSIQGEAARTLFMALGWVINLGVAEWIIRKPNLKFKKTMILTN